MCRLRQRDTYPATRVAPLSKGDAAAVTFIYTIDVAIAPKNNCSTVALQRGDKEATLFMYYQTHSPYGKKILATLLQRLTARNGKGYTYSALTRMMKVDHLYNNRGSSI